MAASSSAWRVHRELAPMGRSYEGSDALIPLGAAHGRELWA